MAPPVGGLYGPFERVGSEFSRQLDILRDLILLHDETLTGDLTAEAAARAAGDATAVKLTGTQTIAGDKDFTGAVTKSGNHIALVREGPLSLLDDRVNADNTGATSTVAAITTAINMLPTDGGELFAPKGIYKGLPVIDRDNVKLRGEGPGSVFRRLNAGDAGIIKGGGGITNRSKLYFSDLTLDGESQTGAVGVLLQHVNVVDISRVTFKLLGRAAVETIGGFVTEIGGEGNRMEAIGSGGTGSEGWGYLFGPNTNGAEFYRTIWKGCVMSAAKVTGSYHVILTGTAQSCGNNAAAPYTFHILGGADTEIAAYCEANGFDRAGSAEIFAGSYGGSYAAAVRVRGIYNGSNDCDHFVKTDGVRGLEVAFGTTVFAHKVSTFDASANITGLGIIDHGIDDLGLTEGATTGAGAAAVRRNQSANVWTRRGGIGAAENSYAYYGTANQVRMGRTGPAAEPGIGFAGSEASGLYAYSALGTSVLRSKSGLGLASFTTAGRPAATSVPAGTAVWNSTTGRINVSNQVDWTDGMGNVV